MIILDDIKTIDDRLCNYLTGSRDQGAYLTFREPRSNDFWQALNDKVFKEFGKYITVKFFAEFGDDFSFLAFLTHIKTLKINTSKNIILDSLPRMESVEHLRVGDVDWTEYSLNFLQKFQNLKHVTIGGSFVDAKNFQLLPHLTSLELTYNDNVLDYSFLKELTQLKELYVTNHEFVTDLSPIGNLTTLSLLDLYNIAQLKNVDFLADMQGLEELELTLPALQKFPVLSARPPIKRLVLEEIPPHCDFSAVAHLTSLEEFYIKETDTNPKMLMQVLEQLPHLKRARFDLDDENWDKVNTYLASRGIDYASMLK